MSDSLALLAALAAVLVVFVLGLRAFQAFRDSEPACPDSCSCDLCRDIRRTADIIACWAGKTDERSIEFLRVAIAAFGNRTHRAAEEDLRPKIRSEVEDEIQQVVLRFAASCSLGDITDERLRSLLTYLMLETGLSLTWRDMHDLRRQLQEAGVTTVSGETLGDR